MQPFSLYFVRNVYVARDKTKNEISKHFLVVVVVVFTIFTHIWIVVGMNLLYHFNYKNEYSTLRTIQYRLNNSYMIFFTYMDDEFCSMANIALTPALSIDGNTVATNIAI